MLISLSREELRRIRDCRAAGFTDHAEIARLCLVDVEVLREYLSRQLRTPRKKARALLPEKVQALRLAYARGRRISDIARDAELSTPIVHNIVHGYTYLSVPLSDAEIAHNQAEAAAREGTAK